MTTSNAPERSRFVLVGAGRVGTGVASLLRAAGHEPVGVVSRTASSAERAARLLHCPVSPALDELPAADLILIGAGESAIGDLAGALALQVVPGVVVIHLAGALGVEPLRPVVAIGARAAALHPVQAMPSIEHAIRRLPGSAWGVTCAPDLRAWAHALIRRDLGGLPIDVPEEDRALWHAASVTTSNGIAGLLSAGERILTSIGIDAPELVLGPLAAGTVANAREAGGGSATLTGPAVRGERETIERHLTALKAHAPELLLAYRLAAEIVLDGARAGGRIESDEVTAMQALLMDER